MDEDKLAEIKNRINIVDLISSYVALIKGGKNYKGLCPFHNEKTPSFIVSPELQIFKCFGCQEGGDAFSFIQKIEGMDFPSSVKYLADKAGVKIEFTGRPEQKERKDVIFELNHLASEYYHYILTKHKLGVKALEYFKKKRFLTDATIKAFKLGYSPNSWRSLCGFLISKGYRIDDIAAAGLAQMSEGAKNYYDRFRGRVIFPFINNSGNVIGFSGRTLSDGEEPKYINTPETEAFHKGNVLFGLEKAKVAVRREKLAIVVEGHMDVISAHQGGFDNVVGTGGTSLTLEQLKLLKRLAGGGAFCFDTDLAGLFASGRAIELGESLNINVKVVVIPKPYKDLDECIRDNPKKLREAINDSKSVYDFYFLSAFERFSPNDPLDKKRIAETLAPVISSIRNPVLKEHYVKRLAGDLGVSEESVYSMLTSLGGGSSVTVTTLSKPLQGVSLQEYALSLLLKSPLDIASSSLYKLGQRDFTNTSLERIFVELKDHIIGRKKKFEIKYFCAKIAKVDEELSKEIQALYLKDIKESIFEDAERLKNELNLVLRRIKLETAKDELKILGGKIKEAEAKNDTAEVKRLTEEFKEISERLI